MRISDAFCRKAAFLLLPVMILATSAVLSFLLEPYQSSSDRMWTGYRDCPAIERVYTGTSQALSSIDPEASMEQDGIAAYNMATNMQSFADSYEVIRCAAEDHHITEAVLAIDHEMLDTDRYDNFRADASFWHGKGRISSFPERCLDTFAFVTDPAFIGKPASVTYFFPWIYNRSGNIAGNVRDKLSGVETDAEGVRTAYGFEPSDETIDPSQAFISLAESKEWTDGHPELASMAISESNKKELARICRLCRENGIRLTAIVVPYPNFMSIHNAYSYRDMTETLRELFASESFAFYDFNLIDPSFYEKDYSDFKDVGHMNSRGAARFSAFLADFLEQAKEKDMQDAFLYDWLSSTAANR